MVDCAYVPVELSTVVCDERCNFVPFGVHAPLSGGSVQLKHTHK
jgi:hypothetical protein